MAQQLPDFAVRLSDSKDKLDKEIKLKISAHKRL
jgi:hypothetical protein